MEIEVVLFGPLRDAAGEKSMTLALADGATVTDALDGLVAKAPDVEDQLPDGLDTGSSRVVVAKNDVSVAQLDGAETPLTDGDTLRLSPPITGGAVGER